MLICVHPKSDFMGDLWHVADGDLHLNHIRHYMMSAEVVQRSVLVA